MKQLFNYCQRRWFFLTTVFVVLFAQTSPPVKADSFFGVARPYYFSIARWEVENLSHKWRYQFFADGAVSSASASDQKQTVEEYFQLVERANSLKYRLSEYVTKRAAGDNPGLIALKQELAQVDEQGEATRTRVEAIIEGQLSDAIREAGVNLEWPFPRFEFYFPPVGFKLTPLPNVLIVSPRNRIEIKDSLLIKSPLSPEDVNALEEKQEKLGHSALVDSIGGVATYPAMVTDSANLEFTIKAAAHEWVHHYLFLRPLGREYGSDYTMLTLNESAADIIGGELANAVLKTYGIKPETKEAKKERRQARKEARERDKAASAAEKPFSFNREMRRIRLAVDDYLARGEIEPAEKFMEERRQFLASQGYYIRKLNQAYFAFHGSYSESPSSSSPIAGELETLRQQYTSLGQFARAVSGISTYPEFKALFR